MIQPHGGTLINKVLPNIEKKRVLENLDEFEKVTLNPPRVKVVKNIAFGVFSPLYELILENYGIMEGGGVFKQKPHFPNDAIV